MYSYKKILILLPFIFCNNSCSKNEIKPATTYEPIESSPGMNGGIYTPREFSPVQNTEKIKKNENQNNFALAWLAHHQEEDGHWDTGKYEGNGTVDINTATTCIALLAFLGAGHTVQAGKWKYQVKKTIDWLVNSQNADGRFAKNNYVNGICTMAIAEALGMGCGEKELRHAVELSVDYLLKQQNPSGGFYYDGSQGNGQPSFYDDISVTTWCILGLKSAKLAGIKDREITSAFKKSCKLLNEADFTKDNSPTTKGEAWYRANSVQGSGKSGGTCQAMAIFLHLHLGMKENTPWIIAATQAQLANMPIEYKGLDVYKIWFVVSGIIYRYDRESWKIWDLQVYKIVTNAQRQNDDLKGSWDLTGCPLDVGGRILYTAMFSMYLEQYPRLWPVMK